MRRFLSSTVLIIVLSILPLSGQKKSKKLKPEDFLAKHLASIGAPQSRANRTTLRAEGLARMEVMVGQKRNLEGTAKLISDGRRFRSSMFFDVSDYPGEDVAFDGSHTYVTQLRPGVRSAIGGFLYTYEELLAEGLFGGTLSTSWALLNYDEHQPRLKHRGLRKFGGSELHELEYQRTTGRTDIEIKLYFLPDTFHHVASIYRLEIPPGLPPTGVSQGRPGRGGTPSDSSGQVGTRVTVEEYFGAFRAVENLALPTSWRIRLTAEGPEAELAALGLTGVSRSLAVVEWTLKYETVEVNPDLGDETFKLY